MKAIRIAALVLAFGCMAVAGWRIYDWSRGEQAEAFVSQPGRAAPTRIAPAAEAPAAGAALPPLPPLKRPASFYLTTIPRHQPPAMSDEDWARAYPALRHAPFDKTGFNAICLPWRFAATPDAGSAEPAVAHAFAFLLNYDLDWSPAAFGNAHAYDVFRHSRDLLTDVEAAYDKAKVAALVGEWGGTHAVGGLLVRGKDGYVATLQVFDRDGAMVHETAYEKPQEFFATLGDVSGAALRFFGTPPNDALAAHLHRRRCERPESLTALGRAALAEPGSPEEVELYETLRKTDPKFAEVRLWRANRGTWSDVGRHPSSEVAAAAFENPAFAAAVWDSVPRSSTAPAPSTLPAEAVVRLEALAGKDHPELVAWRLRQLANPPGQPAQTEELTAEQFLPLVEIASRYPNHRGLLLALAATQKSGQRPLEGWRPPYDAELLASLCLAATFNRAAAPQGHSYEWYRVTEAARDLRRPGHVLAAVARFRAEPGSEENALRCALWAAEARMQLCDFEQAASEFAALVAWTRSDYERKEATHRAAVCAVLTGNVELLQRLAGDPRANVGRSGEFLATCRKYLSGTAVGREDFPLRNRWEIENVPLAEAELAQAGDFMRTDRPRLWQHWLDASEPTDDWRLEWVLLERYYRLQPSLPHAAGFYEAAEWQHPDDPYIAETVAAWRKAGGTHTLPTADEVIANITAKQWQGGGMMSYWTIVARIRRDLEEDRPGDAKRVLAAVPGYRKNRHTLFAWLARKIEQASAPAKR